MKTKLLQERGQALFLIAIALIALLAILGLAVDGSAAFSDRRHAQNAADTAALAGALAKVNGDPYWDLAARDRAAANGYGSLVNGTVIVNNPPLNGIYANCADVHFTCTDYVEVIITSDVKLFFGGILGIDQIHNRVEAVASTITAQNNFNFGGNAIVSLSQNGCDALVVNGGANVTITGGGLFSNSDSSTCSFFRQSCPSGFIDVWTDSSHTTHGSISMVGNTDSPCGYATHAILDSYEQQISFPPPYQEIAEPSVCSQTADLTSTYSVSSGNPKIATLNPGHYSTIPLSGAWKTVILNPGVYCINSTLSSPTTALTVSGTFASTPGVFLYFKSGGYFTINGGDLNIWGINDNSSPYHGFLMYVAPNYSLATPPNCLINGNSNYALKGTIYAPYCAITINGTSNTGNFQSQVIGYTVKMMGTADVSLTYDSSSSATWDIPSQVGLSK